MWIDSQAKVCFWCGVPCEGNFQVDHFHPLSKGGRHELANLEISCPTCNQRKGAKLPAIFAKMVGKDISERQGTVSL